MIPSLKIDQLYSIYWQTLEDAAFNKFISVDNLREFETLDVPPLHFADAEWAASIKKGHKYGHNIKEHILHFIEQFVSEADHHGFCREDVSKFLLSVLRALD